MSGKREDVSVTGAETTSDIGFSFGELQIELRRLHETAHPERQPGEFTIAEYAAAQVPPMTRSQAEHELAEMYKRGKVEKPPKRYIGSNMTVVYRLLQP